MATQEREEISGELLDRLLAGRDAAEVFRSGELIDDLKKAVAERALDAEMEAQLELEHASGSGNHRNGHNRKRVPAEGGAMDLEVPRDRDGRFDPKLVEKYCRRLPGFDEKVVSMYARGMTTREIRGHIEELYGVGVSAELISKVTDSVHEEVREWQSRPLEEVYAIVWFDAVRVKIRDEGLVRNKAVHLAIGVTCAGRKEILGMWIEQTEGGAGARAFSERRGGGEADLPGAAGRAGEVAGAGGVLVGGQPRVRDPVRRPLQGTGFMTTEQRVMVAAAHSGRRIFRPPLRCGLHIRSPECARIRSGGAIRIPGAHLRKRLYFIPSATAGHSNQQGPQTRNF